MRRRDCDIHLNLTDCDWKLHNFETSKCPFACKCWTVNGPCKKIRSVFGSGLSGVKPWCLHPPLNCACFNLSPLILRISAVSLLVPLTFAHCGIRTECFLLRNFSELNFCKFCDSVGVKNKSYTLLLLLLTAIDLSLCGSSTYTSTNKTNKNENT